MIRAALIFLALALAAACHAAVPQALSLANLASVGQRPATTISFNAANIDSVSDSVAGGTTITFAVTISAATDGLADVGFHWFSGTPRTVSGVTFDGTSGTAVRTDRYLTDTVGFSKYTVVIGNKAAGSYNVVVTFSGAVDEWAAGATVWNGVHQSTPWDIGEPTGSAEAGATTETATLTCAAGELVSCLFGQTDTAVTVGGGQTQRWLADNTTLFADCQSSSEPCAVGATTVTMTWASSPAASNGYGYILVALKPAN